MHVLDDAGGEADEDCCRDQAIASVRQGDASGGSAGLGMPMCSPSVGNTRPTRSAVTRTTPPSDQ